MVKRTISAGLWCILALALPAARAAQGPLNYPASPRIEHVDDYNGVKVPDPYRWLEEIDSPQTGQWIAAQNQLTASYLAGAPQRQAIKRRLTALWDYEKLSLPSKEGGRYFYRRNSGLQNQAVLYVAETLESEPRALIDPNTLSADGTIALQDVRVSHDGKLLAYGLSSAGSDWQEWKVRQVDNGADRPDHIRWVKFGGAVWTHDNQGFFYARFPEPAPGQELRAANHYQKIYYHRLGTRQSEDRLIYERPDQKEWYFHPDLTEDGRYLIIDISRGTERKNRLFYKDLKDPQNPVIDPAASPVVELLNQEDAQYELVGNDGPVFWFVTDHSAPRRRLIAIDTRSPEPARWKELVAQGSEKLESASVVGERFFLRYLKDACTQVKVHALDGALERQVQLPGLGTAGGFGGKRNDPETFYLFTNFTTPGVIYRHDARTGQSSLYKRPKVAFNPEDYQTTQVFCVSKDGTRIPLFITHKKGISLDGTNPTCLYGYGGFQISITPGFAATRIAWLEMGGVYVVANLRGGGEYGQAWHEAGRLGRKQNVFDDFIAAAQWLIDNRYTSPKRLAIMGGSNGGLLVGACITQRPDLFGAAVPAVGVMDMLRFNKFTVGWGWVPEYGSPEKAEDFKVLYAYSPLHNIKPNTKYPATLVTTGDHDDRVFPAHSFKFAAALQAAQAGPSPILIRIETRAGHGAGKPLSKSIDEAADYWAFLARVFEMPGLP